MASGPITSWQIEVEKVEAGTNFIFLGSIITVDGDRSHKIKRCLLLGRKKQDLSITNLKSILKSRDITLPTKVCIIKDIVFPVVMYECESWTIKKTEHWRNDTFELWVWRRLLRVPWTARRSNQAILKEINSEYSLEGLMLMLKRQYFGYLMGRAVVVHSVVTNSLWPHGLQHARLPCPLPPSRACSNSCPLSQWCHPTISSSAIPFSSHIQSFPASGSFQMSQFFASGGQILEF